MISTMLSQMAECRQFPLARVAVEVSKSSATLVTFVVPLVVLALLQRRSSPPAVTEDAAPGDGEWSQAGAH